MRWRSTPARRSFRSTPARCGRGMAAGDVVNTASRLQSAAPVNGVLVGEQTYRATDRVIEYVAHEPVEAKGKAQPVPVWKRWRRVPASALTCRRRAGRRS